MNSNTRKGWESFVIKIMVVAMSVCYILGPSHNEINKALHFLVHQIEKPQTVINHKKNNDSQHINHIVNHSEKQAKEHHHTLLNTIKKILNGFGADNETSHKKITFNKIDKHIKTKKPFKLGSVFLVLPVKHKYLFITQNIHQGFLESKLQPPRLI